VEEHVDASVAPKRVAYPQRNDDDYEDKSEPMETYENEGVGEHEHMNTSVQELRRSTWVSRPTQRYSPSLFYVLFMDAGEFELFQEAIDCLKNIKWLEATKDEISSLHPNEI